ncbi:MULTISPECIES: thioredoxin family protein [Flavobacterium]|uniref:Thioredoxin family protein n=1 Tax=Flavobacterium lipolyticum TaxID=2893754 RepID=A0ABS8M022_9FLAO|nr:MULTISPECIES: thioredoxin family protein [unclassified Flavobacterium]MCC9018177.1 thioredoxin family protein [Flavobacterium sp. F-126]
MNRKLLILLLFLGSFGLHSQNLIWKTDMNDAIMASDSQKRPLLIFFTAAGVSQRFQSEIFVTPDFAVWSRDNVILVKLDMSDTEASDMVKEQNVKLKNALGIQELPQVCLLMASVRKGKTTFNNLGLVPYKQGGAKAWIADANLILNP